MTRRIREPKSSCRKSVVCGSAVFLFCRTGKRTLDSRKELLNLPRARPAGVRFRSCSVLRDWSRCLLGNWYRFRRIRTGEHTGHGVTAAEPIATTPAVSAIWAIRPGPIPRDTAGIEDSNIAQFRSARNILKIFAQNLP